MIYCDNNAFSVVKIYFTSQIINCIRFLNRNGSSINFSMDIVSIKVYYKWSSIWVNFILRIKMYNV